MDGDLSPSEQAVFDNLYGAEPGEAAPRTPGILAGAYKAAAGVPSALAGIGLDIGQAAVNITDQATKPAQFVGLFQELGNQKPGEQDAVGTALAATQSPFDRANQVIDETRESANELYRPDPQTTGFIGNTLFGAVDVLTRVGVGNLVLPGAGLPLAAGTTGFERTKELEAQGVDSSTAMQSGLLTGGSLLAMGGVTSFGSTTLQRILTGGLTNVGFGAGTRAIDSKILEANGYHAQAEQQKWNDGASLLADAVIGSVFGALPHGGKTRPADMVDAALGAKNAQNAAELAPGVPADPRSSAAHASALDAAVDQLMNGKPVDVDATLRNAEFVERPAEGDQTVAAGLHEALTDAGAAPADLAPTPGGYVAYRRALESGGRADAANPNSSALGPDQFLAATWLKTVADAAPEWAKGLTKSQLLALRTDPAKSAEMAAVLDQSNATALTQAGVEVTDQTLYAAHHFGSKRAVAFANAADDAPMASILTKAELKANPYLDGLTKAEVLANWNRRAGLAGVRPDGSPVDTNPAGQALRQRLVEDPRKLFADYAALADSEGGRVLNTDVARELAPEYLADRTRSADVHEAASDTIKLLYEDKLAQPTPEGYSPVVLFTAGGTGAGKTTAVRSLQGMDRPPELIYDTNMNTLSSAVQKIQQALDAGRKISILYVYRDPVDALIHGALPRAENQAKKFGTGRTVPLAEHARTHAGVRPVIDALAEKYKGDPRVQISTYDNSRGKGRGAFVDLAKVPRVEENGIHERLQAALEEEHRAGRISDATRAGFNAAGRDAQAVQRSLVRGARGEPPEEHPSGRSQAELSQGSTRAPSSATPDTRTASTPEGAGRPQQRAAGADAGDEQRTGLDPARAGEVERAREASANRPDEVLDDGTTVADALRAADQEVTQAETQGKAIEAAVACFLRFGAAA